MRTNLNGATGRWHKLPLLLVIVFYSLSLNHALNAQLTLSAGNHSINTDNGEINGMVSPAFDGTKFVFSSIDIQMGAVVNVTGARPLVVEVSGIVQIDGLLDLSGKPGGNGGGNVPGGIGGIPGPGGFGGGAGGGLSPGTNTEDGQSGFGPGGGGGGINGNASEDSAGGGGGGHATNGENGSTTGPPSVRGVGGSIYASLMPLVGGSGGGGGAFEDDDPQQTGTPGPEDDGGGGGGGGGGAISIVAQSIIIGPSGIIDVSGGKGGNANAGVGAAGGGGGSGGTILLASCNIINEGVLNINGGGRGTGQINAARGGAGGIGEVILQFPENETCIFDFKSLSQERFGTQCNCDAVHIAPSEGFNRYFFRDTIQVESLPGYSFYFVSELSSGIYDENGNPLTDVQLTESEPGSGIYWLIINKRSGVTPIAYITIEGNEPILIPGEVLSVCDILTACPSIPTMNQWALVICFLFILIFGLVWLMQQAKTTTWQNITKD